MDLEEAVKRVKLEQTADIDRLKRQGDDLQQLLNSKNERVISLEAENFRYQKQLLEVQQKYDEA